MYFNYDSRPSVALSDVTVVQLCYYIIGDSTSFITAIIRATGMLFVCTLQGCSCSQCILLIDVDELHK